MWVLVRLKFGVFIGSDLIDAMDETRAQSVVEEFRGKTRYTLFLKKNEIKSQKLQIFFLSIFAILESFVTSGIYIFNVSNNAKVVSGRDY